MITQAIDRPAYLYVTEGRKLHLLGRAAAGGQQGSLRALQGGQADGGQARGAEAEEEGQRGGHDGHVGAEQGRVQQGEDVEQLLLAVGLVALKHAEHLALTPHVTLLQPGEGKRRRRTTHEALSLGAS